MGAWKNFVQRRALKTAIKQGLRASTPVRLINKKGLVFVFPYDPSAAKALAQPLSEWLENTTEKSIKVVIPLKAIEVTKKINGNIETISYDENDITRNGVPTRELRNRVASCKSKVAILLGKDTHPFTEILFARTPSVLKAAVFNKKRSEYINLLVQVKGQKTDEKIARFLLDTISTFAGNHVSNKPLNRE
jgi:hypothetical protein